MHVQGQPIFTGTKHSEEACLLLEATAELFVCNREILHDQERLSFDIISGNESLIQKALEIAYRQGHEQDRSASCDWPVYVYDCKDDKRR